MTNTFRSSCEAIAAADKVVKTTYSVINQVKKNLVSARIVKAGVQYGLTNYLSKLTNLVSTAMEEITNISKVTQQILLNTVGEGISDSVAFALESLLRPLIEIVMVVPAAIFSIVKIPRDKAVEHLEKEHQLLLKAKSALAIILHFAKQIPSEKDIYYSKMKSALPYLDNIVKAINALLSHLNPENEIPYFDQTIYNNLMFNLSQAYDITLTNKGLLVALDDASEVIYEKEKTKIDNKYKKELDKLEKSYNNNRDEKNHVAKSEKYYLDKSILEQRKKAELQIAKTTSKYKGITALTKKYVDNGTNLYDVNGETAKALNLFVFNSIMLYEALKDYKQAISDAYIEYTQYHVLCNTMYNYKDIMKKMFSWIVNNIGKPNPASTSATLTNNIINNLETSKATISTVAFSFDEAKPKEKNNYEKILDGNNMIKYTQLKLNAQITQAVIDTINLNKKLIDSNQAYDKFIKRLHDITDFDGKKGVWAVELLSDTINPYSKLINIDFQEAYNILNQLIGHNEEVYSVVYNYRPFNSEYVNRILKILNELGKLDLFATTLNVAEIIYVIVEDAMKIPGNPEFPTRVTCAKAYPELFNSTDKTAECMPRFNVPAPQTDSTYLHKNDMLINDIHDIRYKASTFNIDDYVGDNDKDLNYPPKSISMY